jgi:hypothetical protein
MSLRSTMQVLGIALALTGFTASEASAQYKATPWTFVGTVSNCGVAGNRIVTSLWRGGLGLQDTGQFHPGGGPHNGLLLSKNGPQSNCSAAGAEIEGITPGDPLTGLGFDFRRGGHCGAGAPRFNVYTNATFTDYYFFGCSAGAHTNAPQDPAQWERVRFSDVDAAPSSITLPPFVFGVTPVYAIEVVFDEGTDIANNDTEGVGLATIDNILINTTQIRKPGNNALTP